MTTKNIDLPSGSNVDGVLQEIPLDQLHESAWNPRQHYPESAMAELTESMREKGWRPWAPAIVRPRDGGGYEIGAAHRRTRAAREAGILTAPCIVRAMTDVEFLDVLNFDNSGREDVHPLHEAAGWDAWMQKTGKGVLDIAARIGKSKEYVYARLKYASLSEDGKRAFLEGQISAGHAILIARLQPEDQKKALKFLQPPDWNPEQKKSVRDLGGFIHRDVHLQLADAKFDLQDATLLAGAGSCETCPKRTKNSPGLIAIEHHRPEGADIDEEDFLEDLAGEDDDPNRPDDECTDPGCFNMKLTNHLIRVKFQLTSAGEDPIAVSGKYGKAKKGLISSSEYSEVEKGSAGAETAIVMDGTDAGTVIYVKVKPAGQKDDWQAREGKRREQQAQERLKIDREIGIRLNILLAIQAKVSGMDRLALEAVVEAAILAADREFIGHLCGLRGVKTDQKKSWEFGDCLVDTLKALPEAEIFRLIVQLSVAEDFKPYLITQKEPAEALLAAAKRYKVDAIRVRNQAEECLKEQQGGTRREVDKKKPAKKAAKKAASKAPAKKSPIKKAPASKKPGAAKK